MAKKTWTPRRVRSEEDRNLGGGKYVRLTDDKPKFLGHALFEGNVAEDEAGWFEYFEHWVPATNRSVPCAGENCPLCEDGDRPKDRANTLWLITQDENGTKLDPPEARTFTMNSRLIKQFTELRAEGDKIKGRLFRITRLDDNGNYGLFPKTEILKAAEVKEAIKEANVDYEGDVTNKLKKAMEALTVARALDDDDDDDDDAEETPAKPKKPAKSFKSKGKDAEPEEDDDEDEDDAEGEWPADGLDEVTVTVKKVEKEGNFIEVTSDSFEGSVKVWTTDDIEFDLTDLSKGDEVTVTTGEKDDDGDYVLTDEPVGEEPQPESDDDDGEAESEDDKPDAIEDEEFEIVAVDTEEQTIDVKNEELELEFTLYFLDKGPASEVDFDDYSEGDKIKVSAEKDSVGDMVATAVPEKVKAKRGGKAAAKKGAAKKGK